jgi:hypothetical protein
MAMMGEGVPTDNTQKVLFEISLRCENVCVACDRPIYGPHSNVLQQRALKINPANAGGIDPFWCEQSPDLACCCLPADVTLISSPPPALCVGLFRTVVQRHSYSLGAAFSPTAPSSPYRNNSAIPKSPLPATTQGLRASYFAGTDCTGSPVLTRLDYAINFHYFALGPGRSDSLKT